MASDTRIPIALAAFLVLLGAMPARSDEVWIEQASAARGPSVNANSATRENSRSSSRAGNIAESGSAAMLPAVFGATAISGSMNARDGGLMTLSLGGEQNAARVTQVGERNVLNLVQDGSRNVAAIDQSGSANQMDLRQSGEQLTLTVSQSGSNNIMAIQQSGRGGLISAVQSGNGNTLNAIQGGAGNRFVAVQR